ncbi:unnamed protein product [Ceutorhynchus assimilis]|uniref:Uncharacterized protein n=1 Tax=Ceutorhynchus assimilis TaxID=467358 RepID=A0A9N9MDL1_9CUCU|nr:unnamed protein product [Ceutorhynchus assimilis]
MLNSIRTLESDLETYRHEVGIKKSKSVQDDLLRNAASEQKSTNFDKTKRLRGKPRILIIGDSTIADMNKILKMQRSLKPYQITSIVKHNAQLEHITEDILNLTKEFSIKDFVILNGGLRNALTSSRVGEAVLERLCQMSVYAQTS